MRPTRGRRLLGDGTNSTNTGRRSVPIPPVLVQMLADWIATLDELESDRPSTTPGVRLGALTGDEEIANFGIEAFRDGSER